MITISRRMRWMGHRAFMGRKELCTELQSEILKGKEYF
jgi:hypothetical protein